MFYDMVYYIELVKLHREIKAKCYCVINIDSLSFQYIFRTSKLKMVTSIYFYYGDGSILDDFFNNSPLLPSYF